VPAEVKRAVSEYADRRVEEVQKTIFPVHDL